MSSSHPSLLVYPTVAPLCNGAKTDLDLWANPSHELKRPPVRRTTFKGSPKKMRERTLVLSGFWAWKASKKDDDWPVKLLASRCNEARDVFQGRAWLFRLLCTSRSENQAAVPGKNGGQRIGGLELKYSIDFLDSFLGRDHDIESKLLCR